MSNFYTAHGAAMTSSRDDWETPQNLFDTLHAHYKFTIDAAATEANAKLERYWTEKDNALTKSWAGERVFCNPPYGRQIAAWIRKAYNETTSPPPDGAQLVVLLIPARTDTAYFHDYLYTNPNATLCFLRGRLKYTLNGRPQQAAPFPSMLATLTPPTKAKGGNKT